MNKGILVNKNNSDSFLRVRKAPDDFYGNYDGVYRVYGISVIIEKECCCKSCASVYRCDKLFIYFRYPYANEIFRYSFSFLRSELL